MNTVDRIELLANHADGLNAGLDYSEMFARRYSDLAPDLLPLFTLARRVRDLLALEPVPELDPQFREQLRAALLYEADISIGGETHASTRNWVGAAALGSLLSVAGLYLVRRYRHRDDGVPATV